ncbi:MAG: quinone-dependent dihydroorotate dehydrogenase, partial [Myxococcaceae bacterium]
MLWRALRWLLFRLDPERAHHLALTALRLLGRRPVARWLRPRAPASLAVDCLGMRFEHPLGLAAGFDKGEVVAPGLFALGFSHVEIGTLTPRPQPGNPQPRL